MYVASQTRLNGLTLKIMQDDHPRESPLDNDDAAIMVVLHRRYVNPAKGVRISKASVKIDPVLDDGESYDFTTPEGVAEFERDNEEDDAAWAVFPLYMYDHSGTIYQPSMGGNPFSCQWDSGRVGIIALKKSGFDVVTTPYFESAKAICEEYTHWANGNIFGYVIEDETGDELDACWGFIGDSDGYVLTEGKSVLVALAAKHRPTANIRLTADEALVIRRALAGHNVASDNANADHVLDELNDAFPDQIVEES